jgi:formate dehydrogenase iron-sulfur subunit
MTPACAKACPTASIQFGEIEDLHRDAHARVEHLQASGVKEAYLYGVDAENQPGTGGLNAFFLLLDQPEVYNLPPDPLVPTKKAAQSWRAMLLTALGTAAVALGAVIATRGERAQ